MVVCHCELAKQSHQNEIVRVSFGYDCFASSQ